MSGSVLPGTVADSPSNDENAQMEQVEADAPLAYRLGTWDFNCILPPEVERKGVADGKGGQRTGSGMKFIETSRLIRISVVRAGVVFLAFFTASLASAEAAGEAAEAAAASNAVIEEIVVVGSRRRDRSAADSPVPVDVVGGDEFAAQGDSNMDSLIASLVPSYNVSQEPISDAATFIRPATLRGLAPDATLVLVNGKRRHRAAVIALLGAGISGGAQGADVSVIPAIALDRLEVLRDGASAQYGSDAIAGIMNFVLKEDNSGMAVDAKWGSHYEGDGDALTLAANVGLPLTEYGFANLSFEWKESDPTSRSRQRGDAQELIDAGNTNVRQPAAQIWGSPDTPTISRCSATSASISATAWKPTPSATGRSARSRAVSTFVIRTPATACSMAAWWTVCRPSRLPT